MGMERGSLVNHNPDIISEPVLNLGRQTGQKKKKTKWAGFPDIRTPRGIRNPLAKNPN